MANSGNDWRGGGGGSSRSRRPVRDKSGDALPPKSPAKPAERSGWRQKKPGQVDPERAEKLKGKDYLRRKDQTQRQKSFQHKLKLAAWTGSSLILLVVLLVILLLWPKQVQLVSIIATNYDSPLPPNSYAKEDGRLLDALASTNNQNITVIKETKEFPPHDRFLSELELLLNNVRPGGPGKKTYMIYLSAHGVVNEAGEACLLLGDMDPLNSSEWIPLSAVFAKMNSVEKLNKPEVIKVLILDSGRLTELWDAGIFYNGFADALTRSVNEAREKMKNLYVLHSCSAGESNGSGPELNGSAFGHYVCRGLNYEADKNNDNTVTLYELYTYVRSRVNTWSINSRGESQRPLLIPAVEESSKVALAHTRWSPDDFKIEPDRSLAEKSGRLNDLWDAHKASRPSQTLPLRPGWLGHLPRGLAARRIAHVRRLRVRRRIQSAGKRPQQPDSRIQLAAAVRCHRTDQSAHERAVAWFLRGRCTSQHRGVLSGERVPRYSAQPRTVAPSQAGELSGSGLYYLELAD